MPSCLPKKTESKCPPTYSGGIKIVITTVGNIMIIEKGVTVSGI